jgi:hypothetical protein
MRSLAIYMALAAIALCVSCSKDHENLPTSFAFEAPPTPTNVVVTGGHESSTISWSYPSESRPLIEEFRVYQYVESYDAIVFLGTTTDTVFVESLLIGNLYYCYEVSAVDTTGFEGWRTESTCAFVRSAGERFSAALAR